MSEILFEYSAAGSGGGAQEELVLSVARGELVAVVGVAGAGKSALLETFLSWQSGRPAAGRLWFKGEDMAELASAERRELLSTALGFVRSCGTGAMVPGLLPGAGVREELAMRLGDSTTVTALLSGLGAAAPESSFRRPLDLLAPVDRTRGAVALALALEPEVLIVDEPFRGVPLLQRAALADDLGRQRQGRGLLLLMRDLALAGRFADRIAIIDRGAIVDFGPAEELLSGSLHPATHALIESSRHRPGPSALTT